eukprot:TRINITY_DN118735_c0_g1_i2.p1 TRINITY_DN118735_c0_g1~~TRINITY_DN118735_c0_g1_i2.p1  ORF type:complete len:144 (+),score=16.43 TRINITY_DN118735_c0_g1_i2:124-555(+)
MPDSLISHVNRKTIHEYLFKEGVVVVKKEARMTPHPRIDVPNLHVLMVLRSLKSKGFVEQRFNWLYHYYFLTNDGIEHLRDVLSYPCNVHPATLQKPKPPRPMVNREFERPDNYAPGNRGYGRGRQAPAPTEQAAGGADGGRW